MIRALITAALMSSITLPVWADDSRFYNPVLDGPQVDPITVWEEMAKVWVGLPSSAEVQGANASEMTTNEQVARDVVNAHNYRSALNRVGYFGRASAVCDGSSFDAGISLWATAGDVPTFAREYPNQAQAWVIEGAELFNWDVMKIGIGDLCRRVAHRVDEDKAIAASLKNAPPPGR
jgi:hypothetical protein